MNTGLVWPPVRFASAVTCWRAPRARSMEPDARRCPVEVVQLDFAIVDDLPSGEFRCPRFFAPVPVPVAPPEAGSPKKKPTG